VISCKMPDSLIKKDRSKWPPRKRGKKKSAAAVSTLSWILALVESLLTLRY
jgi:hypothetical protein